MSLYDAGTMFIGDFIAISEKQLQDVQTMRISIKALTGETITLNVKAEDTIDMADYATPEQQDSESDDAEQAT